MTSTMNGGGQTTTVMNMPYHTTVSMNAGDCDDKVVELPILFNVHSSKYSTTP